MGIGRDEALDWFWVVCYLFLFFTTIEYPFLLVEGYLSVYISLPEKFPYIAGIITGYIETKFHLSLGLEYSYCLTDPEWMKHIQF